MGRMPVPHRIASLSPEGCPPGEPWGITRRFHRLCPGRGLVAYALRTRAPLSCPEGHLPFDLHVLGLPLAFILSQDQTLHCIIVLLICFFPEITGLAVCSFRLSSLPAPRLAADAPLTFLCWPSSFQRTLANLSHFSAPRSSRLRVQKYYIFPYLQQLFSLFFKLFPSALSVREINFTYFAIIAAWRRSHGRKRGVGGTLQRR